ncbi:hypothetical protein GIB67_027659 [Kingdonia uniflora]|uniref:SHSP domain-containing protein n=1 Tax=Kingdonia uniflora TaxID=39325 RepID=A0A7J7NKV1_9MAGN|nr:hypothetical protein GIB67_027659 [Kingdonia uniflora]
MPNMKREILKKIQYTAELSKGKMNNNIQELQTIKILKVQCKANSSVGVQSSFWELPMPNEVKLCCDGYSIGNPGAASIRVVFQDSEGDVLGVFSKAIGTSTSFVAEILAILTGIQKAVARGWLNIWVISDSETAIRAFKMIRFPRSLRYNGVSSRKTFGKSDSAKWRECNFSTDLMARRGSDNAEPFEEDYRGRPTFLTRIEMENVVNIAVDIESDSLNEVLGFGGDDDTQDSLRVGGGSIGSRPPSKGKRKSLGGASSRVCNSSSKRGMDALKVKMRALQVVAKLHNLCHNVIVKVEVEEGRVLQISGERNRDKGEKNDKWHRIEWSSGKFLRRFRLPENTKMEEVKAGMENGVLTITVPMVEKEGIRLK